MFKRMSNLIGIKLLTPVLCLVLMGYAGGAHADTIGDLHVFFTSSQFEFWGLSKRAGTLQFISAHAYWYVGDEYWSGLSFDQRIRLKAFISTAAGEFDTRIYPTETAFFGSEPNPGIDNDARITIFITPLKPNIGGYFDTGNEYKQSDVPSSNEREMITITSPVVSDSSRYIAYLAHEFQHMISFNQRENIRHASDDVWLNELRSEYAITLNGYNDSFEGSSLQRRLPSFKEHSGDSLTEWRNASADYGVINLFGEYIAEHTSPRVIAATNRTRSTGIAGLNEALAQEGFQISAVELFSNWLVAVLVNDSRASSLYAYTRPGLATVRVLPTQTILNPVDGTVYTMPSNVKDWEGRWYDISGLTPGTYNTLRISFNSLSPSSFHVPYIVYRADGTYTVNAFDPTSAQNALYISQIGSAVTRVVVMPFKKDKLSDFGSDEPSTPMTVSLSRVDAVPAIALIPNSANRTTQTIARGPHPEDFGLSSGDFIRVQGEANIYQINARGFKRLIPSAAICKAAAPGSGGCFSFVKTVLPAVQDAFELSAYVANPAQSDGTIYRAVRNQTGAVLVTTRMQRWNFSGLNPDSIFLIAAREHKLYR